MGHYHLSTVANVVQQITYVSFPGKVLTAFCQWDLYRVSFSSTSWLDFCFVPLTPGARTSVCLPGCSLLPDSRPASSAQCPTNNCPTAPFVNYGALCPVPGMSAAVC